MDEISIGDEMDVALVEGAVGVSVHKEHVDGSKRSVSESQASSETTAGASQRKNLKRSISVVPTLDVSPTKTNPNLQPEEMMKKRAIMFLPISSPITPNQGPPPPAPPPISSTNQLTTSPTNQLLDLNNRSSPPKMRVKRSSVSPPYHNRGLPSPVCLSSTDQEVLDLTEADLTQDQPQDLSRPRSSLQSHRRTPPPPYPVELQLNVRARMKEVLKEVNGKENSFGDDLPIKREIEDPILGGSSSAFDRLPIVSSDKILDVIQNQIMVAETVKYPVNYPALIPLSPSVAGLGGVGGGYSCSSSIQHANFSPVHTMDQKPLFQQQQQKQPQPSPQGTIGNPHHNGQDNTPVGLSDLGLHLPATLEQAAQLCKKDMLTQRKQREFIPDNKKDESYWDRRRRNNEAAKRSREKRRFSDMILEQRVIELFKENHIMKAQLNAIKDKHGIMGENLINVEQVIANMPQTDQIIALNKRKKFNSNIPTLGCCSPSLNSLLIPEGSMGSPTPTLSMYSGNDAPDSPQNYSYYESAHDDHDSHFDSAEQYLPSYCSDLYYRASALNLSIQNTSRLPLSPITSHMEYSPASNPERCRRSPISDAGSSLPHKLRHKSHLGDKDSSQSLLALQGIKAEPHDPRQEATEESVGSSDERDSGISISCFSSCSDRYPRSSNTSSFSPINYMMNETSSISSSRNQQPLHLQHYQQQQEQHQKQQQQDSDKGVADYENTQLRSEMERLASEVATIKYLLVRNPRSEGDSDGSH